MGGSYSLGITGWLRKDVESRDKSGSHLEFKALLIAQTTYYKRQKLVSHQGLDLKPVPQSSTQAARKFPLGD